MRAATYSTVSAADTAVATRRRVGLGEPEPRVRPRVHDLDTSCGAFSTSLARSVGRHVGLLRFCLRWTKGYGVRRYAAAKLGSAAKPENKKFPE
jgi:hypothetical protein